MNNLLENFDEKMNSFRVEIQKAPKQSMQVKCLRLADRKKERVREVKEEEPFLGELSSERSMSKNRKGTLPPLQRFLKSKYQLVFRPSKKQLSKDREASLNLSRDIRQIDRMISAEKVVKIK